MYNSEKNHLQYFNYKLLDSISCCRSTTEMESCNRRSYPIFHFWFIISSLHALRSQFKQLNRQKPLSYLQSQGIVSKAVWTEFTAHPQEGGPARPDQAGMVLTTAENLTHYKDRKLRWQKCTNHLGKHAELISFAVRFILWQTKGRTCCYKSREGRKEGRFKEKANLHFCCCWWEADNSVESHHETVPFAFSPASCLMQLTLESDKPTAS